MCLDEILNKMPKRDINNLTYWTIRYIQGDRCNSTLYFKMLNTFSPQIFTPISLLLYRGVTLPSNIPLTHLNHYGGFSADLNIANRFIKLSNDRLQEEGNFTGTGYVIRINKGLGFGIKGLVKKLKIDNKVDDYINTELEYFMTFSEYCIESKINPGSS